MTTRIVNLPKHNKVLIGRDLSQIFEPGYVYEFKKFSGEIIVTCLGKLSLPESGVYPNQNSNIESIMFDGRYLITEEEMKTIIK